MPSEPRRDTPRKRIETVQQQEPLGSLESLGALAGLNLPDLPAGPAAAPPPPEPLWKMGRVVLRKETAHRGGKVVIVVHDFATHVPGSVIETMAKKLRAGCGCGGAVKARSIEIQGDQAARVRAILEAEGFQVAGVR